MKKIFAIALALVMVFSMASAFALNDCFSGFDWSCPTTYTDCGKAKVEVVPYVLENNGCGDVDWVVSDCATAIKTKEVAFAIKMTVDAYVDADWYAEAEVEVELVGLVGEGEYKVAVPADVKYGEDEAQVFYLKADGKWINEEDKAFDLVNVVHETEVLDAKKAEVCATLTSEHDGFKDSWTYGDYKVKVATTTDASGDFGTLTITEKKCNNEVVITWKEGEVVDISTTSEAFRAEVFAKFNLTGCGFGTCIDAEIVQRNFGWDDEFENCFKWSTKGASVVNPECVVAIPKTGDVSVVAYAVMAVVAAAGAMLKK